MMHNDRKWDIPVVNDLNAPDPSLFEFVPDWGYRYHGNNRSIVLGATSITKSGAYYDDNQLRSNGEITQQYIDSIRGLPEYDYNADKIFTDRDFRPYRSEFAYKFVTEEIYTNFVSNAEFLVSSLSRFRKLEDQGSPAGDRFEGSAHSAYSVADRQLTVSTLSGFDTHIFSLTRDLREIDRMRKFGNVILRVRLVPFAYCLADLLGSTSMEISLVRYSDLKLFRSQLSLSDVKGYPPDLTPRLAQALQRAGRNPSLFAKPNRFAEEREVRIAITAHSDVAEMTPIHSPKLLSYVERIA